MDWPQLGPRSLPTQAPAQGFPNGRDQGSHVPNGVPNGHTDPHRGNHLHPQPLTPQDPERTDWRNQVPTCGGPLALHAITLPGPQRQTPEGQVPSWGPACAPAILAGSTRTAEAKVGGHPLPGGPPTLLRTSARRSQLTGKRRPGSHPSFGPTGLSRIHATTPSITSEARATFLRGQERASCLTPFSSTRRSLHGARAMGPPRWGPAYSPHRPPHRGPNRP